MPDMPDMPDMPSAGAGAADKVAPRGLGPASKAACGAFGLTGSRSDGGRSSLPHPIDAHAAIKRRTLTAPMMSKETCLMVFRLTRTADARMALCLHRNRVQRSPRLDV
jgi:hypothetical protein